MKTILTLTLLCVFSFHLHAQVVFTTSSTLGVGGAPRSVVAEDMNGDGRVDLITANLLDNTLTVLTNNGTGNFFTAGIFAVGNSPNMVTAEDINGDGKLDLINANYGGGGGNTLSVLTNNGSGSFTLAATPTVGTSPLAVEAADINGDGRADLISANSANNSLSVLTNNGSSGFVLAFTQSVGAAPYSLTAADVNADGKSDIISGLRDANLVIVLTNNGNGGLVQATTLAVAGGPWWVAAADVNNDYKIDLISANYSTANSLSVLTNNGFGGFVLASTQSVGGDPWSVAAADVNGDGKVDLISANFGGGGGNTLTTLTNNGSGGFALATTLTVGSGPVSVTTADVNLDGKIDLVDANYSANTVSVLTNSTPFPPDSPPIITIQPISQTNVFGSNVAFNVAASSITGLQLFNYQWRLGGTNLPTATNSTLQLPNIALSHAGIYDVVVANSAGSVTSSPAILDVRFIGIKVNGQFTPPAVSVVGSALVTLHGGFPGGYLYYTLDGSLPNFSSPLYSGGFNVTNSCVVNVLSLNSTFTQTAFANPVTINVTPTFSLQTSVIGQGTVSNNPSGGTFVSNTVVTLTAIPFARWAFDHWAGDATNNFNPLNLVMDGPKNIQAVFVQTSFPLIVTSPGGGRVTTNGQTITGTNFFSTGTTLSLTAVASNGWTFMRWQGTTNSTANPIGVTVDKTNNIQAIFGTVVGTNSIGGSVILNLTNPIAFGTTLTVSALPDTGNYFAGWVGNISGTNSPARILVTNANPIASALFSPLPVGKFSLNVIVVGSGFETNTPLRPYYSPGDVVTLRAITNSGTLFLGWSLDASGTNNPLTVTMTTNKIIQANFGILPQVNITPLTQTVLAGSNIVLVANAVGIPPLAYQWFNDLGAITGSTNFFYVLANTHPTNAGNYFVVVTNLSGATTSSLATVTVIGTPVITNQPPADTTVIVGHSASFSAGAYGWPALNYRWQLNGGGVSGATSNSLLINHAFPVNAGSYTLVITNIYGSVTSSPAVLNVLPLNINSAKTSVPGQFKLSFDTASGVNYSIEYSTNLVDWIPWITIGGLGQPLSLTDGNLGGISHRFYRINLMP